MNRKQSTEVIRTVDLDHEQLLILDHSAGARIRVLSGGTWLTEEGRLDDVHALAGDAIRLTSNGRAVLEGLGRTRVEIASPQRSGWRSRVADAWRLGHAVGTLRGTAVALSLVIGLGVTDLVARGLQHAGATTAARAA